MGQCLDTAAAGWPTEPFVTDIRAQMLPGNNVRFVVISPVDGSEYAFIVPYGTWLEWRIKLAAFAAQCAATATIGGREMMVLAH